jgi:chromosome segregation ATPase
MERDRQLGQLAGRRDELTADVARHADRLGEALARIDELEGHCERLDGKNHNQARTIDSYAESYEAACDLAARLEAQRDKAEADAADQATRRARCEGRIRELEAECERHRRRLAELEPHAPIPGRTLRFHNPRSVTLKRPGHCSVTDHIPEWLEVHL